MQDFYGAEEGQGDIQNPLCFLPVWLEKAKDFGDIETIAVQLATSDENGYPNIRVVYAREITDEAIGFYTNYLSKKGQELRNNRAAMNFYFPKWQRQIRLRGIIEKMSDKESDDYFFSRPEGSRLGAWVSKQSQELASRAVMVEELKNLDPAFANKRPPHWGGYYLRPLEVEYWAMGEFRLHDRYIYRRDDLEAKWQRSQAYP